MKTTNNIARVELTSELSKQIHAQNDHLCCVDLKVFCIFKKQE